MRRRIALTAGLFALTAALGLTGCGDGNSKDTGVPDKPSKVLKDIKGGKGHVVSDELPPPPR